ncbi:hypothetical protein HY628_02115 [Candidatus Uhrbacteria bacterium]|nr:hypothetical protein [Candidatus Uhrbacteria bacterium]
MSEKPKESLSFLFEKRRGEFQEQAKRDAPAARQALPDFIAIFNLAENIGAAGLAKDSPQFYALSLRLAAVLLKLLIHLQKLHEEKEQQAEKLHWFERVLESARADVGRETAERAELWESEERRLQTKIRNLEEAIARGDGGLLNSLVTFIRQQDENLTKLLEQGLNLKAILARVRQDVTEHLPKLIENDLEKSGSALSEEAAPLLTYASNLTAADLHNLRSLLQKFDQLEQTAQTLQSLAQELENDFRTAKKQYVAWKRQWIETQERLRAGRALLPAFGFADFFTLIGATDEIARLKQQQVADLELAVARELPAVDLLLGQRAATLTAVHQQITDRTGKLEHLRKRFDLQWFEVLPAAVQEQCRILLFAFAAEDQRWSTKYLAEVLGKAISASESLTDETIIGLLHPPFFRPAHTFERFKLYTITPTGWFWRNEWAAGSASEKRVAEICAALRGKKKERALEESEQRRLRQERKLKKDEERKSREARRKTQQAQTELQKEDPLVIQEGLKLLERQILYVTALTPVPLPGPRDGINWAALLAAARHTKLVSSDDPKRIAEALMSLFAFSPALFERTPDHTRLTPLGKSVAQLLPTPHERAIEQYKATAGKSHRSWEEALLSLRDRFTPAFIEKMRKPR